MLFYYSYNNQNVHQNLRQNHNVLSRILEPTTLPAVEYAATTRINPERALGIYFQQLGKWAHNYQIAGAYREVFLKLELGKATDVVIDVQFPVKKFLQSGKKALLD